MLNMVFHTVDDVEKRRNPPLQLAAPKLPIFGCLFGCPALRKSGVRAPLSRGSHHELAHAVKKTRAARAAYGAMTGCLSKGRTGQDVESLHGL